VSPGGGGTQDGSGDREIIKIFGRQFEHPEHLFIRNLRKWSGGVFEVVLAD